MNLHRATIPEPTIGTCSSPDTGTAPTRERGAALPFVALLLFVLMGMAAFAVDLGWFYLHANRVQRAADAAALAGVIHMPQDFPLAEADAIDIAEANGYVIGGGTDVTVSQVTGQPNQIQVTVRDSVETFFLKAMGRQTQEIERSARAEFLPPLPLGSPENQFGNDCDPSDSGCSGPNFWANIHGKYTRRGMGDAFTTFCAGGSGTGCGATNTLFRERGYLYGIEVPAGQSFTVGFTDMTHHNPSGSHPTNDNYRTGDRGCEDWGDDDDPDCGQTVTTTLYAPDADPLDVSNNTELCSYTWDPQAQVDEDDPYPLETPAGCLTVSGASEGIYVLQIEVEEPSEQGFSGLNRYGVQISNSNGKLYALGDMSIYNNFGGSTTDFYLAEVDTVYRGKTYVVELFDPGEGNGFVQLMSPDGAGWSIHDSCRLYTRPTGVMTGPWTDEGTRSPCQFQANNSDPDLRYDDRWVRLEVTLPDDYDCSSNCWWKINYDYTGGVNDTTTWRAFIVGNPIHLIPSD